MKEIQGPTLKINEETTAATTTCVLGISGT